MGNSEENEGISSVLSATVAPQWQVVFFVQPFQ